MYELGMSDVGVHNVGVFVVTKISIDTFAYTKKPTRGDEKKKVCFVQPENVLNL